MDGDCRRSIAVDKWTDPSDSYFLTHLHADHTKGLSANWARGPLFCSPVSARLLPHRFPGFDMGLVRALEVGVRQKVWVRSGVSGEMVPVEVTPIDACHCPGSVMYFFRGEFGCVLHTGDYRWESNSERAQVAKHTLLTTLGDDTLDILYLDNTYCHPSYSFPSRNMAAQQVANIVTSHPQHDIIIGIDTLGKENLLVYLSKAFHTKIWVWPERLRTMHLLGYDNIFTTSTCLTRIRAVPRYSLTIDVLEAMNTMHPTIGIMPSGLPWGMKHLDKSDCLPYTCSDYTTSTSKTKEISNVNRICSPQRYHKFSYSVPYSDHSCFSEISELVKLLRPSKIIGIVSSSICYINPDQYFGDSGEGSLPLDDESSLNSRRAELGKRLRYFQTYQVQDGGESKIRKGKKGKPAEFAPISVRRSRVSLMRRDRTGAKLVSCKDRL